MNKTIYILTIVLVAAAWFNFGFQLKRLLTKPTQCVTGVDIQKAINSGGLTILK